MCRSVPQMEAARTRTSTSWGLIVGMEMDSSCAPRSGRTLRKAFMVVVGIKVSRAWRARCSRDVSTPVVSPETRTKYDPLAPNVPLQFPPGTRVSAEESSRELPTAPAGDPRRLRAGLLGGQYQRIV